MNWGIHFLDYTLYQKKEIQSIDKILSYHEGMNKIL